MSHIGRWLVATVITLGSRSAAAQPRSAACTFDTAASTRVVAVTAFLAIPGGLSTAASTEAGAYLTALASHLRPPGPLRIPFRPVLLREHLGADPDSIGLGLQGPVFIPLAGSGRIGRGEPAGMAAIGALNEAVEQAVRALDRSGLAPPVPTWTSEDSVGAVQLRIEVSAGTVAGGVAMARAAVPVLIVDSAVRPERFKRPVYPGRWAQRGDGASVDVRYQVREDGTADPEAIEIVAVRVGTGADRAQAAEAFARSAAAAIRDSRFRPAQAGGCPIRSSVRQRIRFTVSGARPDS